MIRKTLAVWVLLSIAAWAAADTGWGRHTEAGEWAFARGDYEKAEAEFRSALQIAQKLPEGDLRLEESLRNLGLFYEHRSRLDEAQPLFLLWLAAREHRLGADSAELLEVLAAVARTSIPVGDHPTALSSLERYVAIADANGGTDEEQLRIVIGTLARVYLLADRGDEALQAQRRETKLTLDNPGLAEDEQCASLESLAQLELQFGDADAAEAAYERNIQIRRETNPEADVTDILAAGARTALDAGELDVASRLAERAARDAVDAKVKHSAEKTLADAAWMKVRRMSDRIADLAAVDADPEALGRAAEALDAVLEWQTVELGAIHADRVETLNRMVSVAVMQRDLDRAAQIQQRLVDAYRTATGAASIQTRTALQGLVDIQRIDPERLELAAEANEQLAAAEKEAWGATDSRRRSTLELQLEMLRALKQKKQAKAVKKMLRKLD